MFLVMVVDVNSDSDNVFVSFLIIICFFKCKKIFLFLRYGKYYFLVNG